jgi:predicted  nucleic acid-binding Zn-ribbon protein
MRILIFHGRLTSLTGGEVNTRDWALALKARGHRVVIFSVYPGPLAEQIRNAGIAVVDNPSSISDTPDIMFGTGVNDVATLLARFPGVPAVQVAQIWDHWNAYPCPLPQIVLHVAVDELNAEMLVNEFGVPRERVRIVHNAVDVARLPPRRNPLPPRPARALVLVKQDHAYIKTLQAVCAQRAIEVDFVGHPLGRPIDDPLAAMAHYDLVIGSARTALEGAVAGAAVVVADHRGLAGMLTSANLDHFRRNNFGREVLTHPLDAAGIGAEIDRYDAADAALVAEALRREATLDRQIERLEAILAEAVALFQRDPPSAEDAQKALASYLAQHLPRPAAGDPAPRHVRFPPNPWIDEKLAGIEKRLSALPDQLAAMEGQLAERLSGLEQRLSVAAGQIAETDRRLSAAGEAATGMDQRLSAAAEAATGMDQRLSAAAEGIAATDQRLSTAVEAIAATEQRLSSATHDIAAADRRSAAMAEDISAINQRLTAAVAGLAAVDQWVASATQDMAGMGRRLTAAADNIATADQRAAAAARHAEAMEQRLSTVEAQVSSVRPLIRLLRPVALGLSRLWALTRLSATRSPRAQQ